MGSLTISNKILDKYFRFLKSLDTNSKKRLILKLEASLVPNLNKDTELSSFFGAWEDEKDSDSIIEEIRNSRVEKSIPKSF
ncbi:hypothetical protein [Aequorivita vladivostokensis]|uniref:Repressor n=1 Tax=Aequorivita vladivostokensis TaxID=171194 RepID=A0ABR5DJ49_9FLAO|nr:hypothetical protein [Aequorivita vladivostokensis]KJJ38771.1 repressor [Aequorivita vladivostokensis]